VKLLTCNLDSSIVRNYNPVIRCKTNKIICLLYYGLFGCAFEDLKSEFNTSKACLKKKCLVKQNSKRF
jgi:hypothetical protein